LSERDQKSFIEIISNPATVLYFTQHVTNSWPRHALSTFILYDYNNLNNRNYQNCIIYLLYLYLIDILITGLLFWDPCHLNDFERTERLQRNLPG